MHIKKKKKRVYILSAGEPKSRNAGDLQFYFFSAIFFFFYKYNAEDYATFKSIFFFYFFAFLFLQLSETITSWQTGSNEDKKLNTLGDSSTACYSHYCLLCLSTLLTHAQMCAEENASANDGPFSLLHIFGVHLFSPCMMSLLARYCNTCRSDVGNANCMSAARASVFVRGCQEAEHQLNIPQQSFS